MANPEHVAVAKRRTYAIARWRARFFQSRERLDLSGAYLSGVKMPGVDLAYDDLTEIDLTSADLHNGNFTGAALRDAHLSRCNLSRSIFTDSRAVGAFFTRSDLRDATSTMPTSVAPISPTATPPSPPWSALTSPAPISPRLT